MRPPGTPARTTRPTLELTVESVAFGGRAVARVEGKIAFIPFALPGERIIAAPRRERRGYLEAELVEILEPSPRRVEPRCPLFTRCGGCCYQHASYPLQLEIKSCQVEETLRRLGRLRDLPLRPIVPSPLQYGYRNRITVHCVGVAAGFFARESRRVIDVETCPIASEPVNRALARLRRSRHRRDGHRTLHDDARAPGFRQVNDAVADLLCALVRASLPHDLDLLVDAYCGGGMLARAARGLARRTVGIDWSAPNIAQAQSLAADAPDDESYLLGDVARHLPPLLESAPPERTALIVDPPATGLARGLPEILLRRPPARLVYVSCDPSTLARDLSRLAQGFRLESLTPLDMFPQTAEIETVALLAPLAPPTDPER